MNRTDAPRTPSADRLRFAREVEEPIRAVVADAGIVGSPEDMRRFTTGWIGSWSNRALLVVQPRSTAELSEVVRICHRTRTPMVPQGGNTGLAGGALPHGDQQEVVISTARMNRIRAIDRDNDTVVVDAGCVLAAIQERAREIGRLFPLSLGAEGSCQIGGNLSTNAGGIRAVRYGTARNLVTGLEVVLPDGRIWDGLRALRKDNFGYDLKQVFIGAEGTLGIITGAALRLLPPPGPSATAMLAVTSPSAALAWLHRAKAELGGIVSSCELMERRCIEIACEHDGTLRDPFAAPYPWYLLVEIADNGSEDDLATRLAAACEAGPEGDVVDGVIASSRQQAAALWHIRERAPESQRHEGVAFKYDVSLPLSCIAGFIEQANDALARQFPGIRSFAFGHLGDGNIHYNPLQASGESPAQWLARKPDIDRVVYDIVAELGGSISAEHGVGQSLVAELPRYRSPLEVEMMSRLKLAFDPHNLMNPGKVIGQDLLVEGS